MEGVIVKTLGGGKYSLLYDNKIYTALPRGKFKLGKREFKTILAVGDRVLFDIETDGSAFIKEIIPRKNKISRKVVGRQTFEHILVANIDQTVIFSSIDNPPIRTGLIDRFLIASESEDIPALICINKIDLGDKKTAAKIKNMYEKLGYNVILTSVIEKTGLAKFKKSLKGKISVLLGHSGVGKSSIINSIQRQIDLKVGEISRKSGKGKHTTSRMEMFPLSFGGFVIDTPGLKDFGIINFDKKDLKLYYPEFKDLNELCKFDDCIHTSEPDCKVKAEVLAGRIDKERYENYKRILETIEYPN